MPSTSDRQRLFMAADYARAKRGERTVTGMDKSKLRDFARKTNRMGKRVARKMRRR